MNVRTQHTQAHGSNDTGSKKDVHNTKTELSATSTASRNCILLSYLWHQTREEINEQETNKLNTKNQGNKDLDIWEKSTNF